MIDRDLIQKILQRLAELESPDVGGKRFFDLAAKEIVHRHLVFMRRGGLIEARVIPVGRLDQNIERVYAIKLTDAGYQALQPELKKAAIGVLSEEDVFRQCRQDMDLSEGVIIRSLWIL